LDNFIEKQIAAERNSGKMQQVVTRFPPEPSGYLHIGHAKSICLNFGLAKAYQGRCHLRFDDTNPTKEKQDYIESIIKDIEWLGFQWNGDVKYCSDYFEQFYQWALYLIDKGLAYVCELNKDAIREYRGTLTTPGRNSPYRDRKPAENRQLFIAMRHGEFAEGTAVLRAKIDMSHPNINMRDPVMYRIQNSEHPKTGTKWAIYPSYDFSHGQADAIEGVTHSLCTLEFSDHQPLYQWFLQQLPIVHRPRQIEFARLQLTQVLTSKRGIKKLIDAQIINSWDDPRLYTLSALRRRGYPPQAIVKFCQQIGVSRNNTTHDIAQLETCVRDYLNVEADRAMAVMQPIVVQLQNFEPLALPDEVTANSTPQKTETTERLLPIDDHIYIEADDFREQANKKYKRLVLNKRVRLRFGFVIEAVAVEKDSDGNIQKVVANVIADTIGKDPSDGIKPKGVIHWVSAKRCATATVVLLQQLFLDTPNFEKDLQPQCNPNSRQVYSNAKVERSLANAPQGKNYQFERQGYFIRDNKADALQFLRTIELRDSYSNAKP